MILLRRLSIVLLLPAGFVLVHAGAASAYDGSQVLNGATVAYGGANSIRVGNGSGLVNGAVQGFVASFGTTGVLSGVSWGYTSSTSCSTGGSNSQQAKDTAYYVYYYVNGSSSGYVISTEPPWEDGYPQSVLYLNGSCTTAVTGADFVFLGSYVTDSSGTNGAVVPFQRAGEQVLLNEQFKYSSQFTARGSKTFTAYAASGNWPWPYPLTAIALLFDVQGRSTDTASNHDAFFVDPVLGSVPAGCATGTANPTNTVADVHLPSQTLGGLAFNGMRIAIPTSLGGGTTSILTAVCDNAFQAGSSVFLTGNWVGYIEPVHHLNETR